jgi:Rieske Fe-S protein
MPQARPKRLSAPRLSRRDVLKAVVIFGAAIVLSPLKTVAQFLLPPRPRGPIVYPKQKVANMNDFGTAQSLLFEYPHKDRPSILIHLLDGFVGYDAVCTHLGCQVHFDGAAVSGWENNPNQSFCPCHGGVFDPKTGKVLGGPPPRPLPKIKLEIDDKGDIYANGYESGLPLYGEG